MSSPPIDTGRRRSVVRALMVAGMALFLLVAGLPGTASAHLFGLIKMEDGIVHFASDEDNLDHHQFWNHFVHFQQRDQYGARTDLTTVERARFDWDDSTDVVWFAAALVAPTIGDQSCRKVVNGRCDRARVRFAERLHRAIPAGTGFWLACHEFGHAYGFEHQNDGCMQASINIGAPPSNVLSAHMIAHINAQY